MQYHFIKEVVENKLRPLQSRLLHELQNLCISSPSFMLSSHLMHLHNTLRITLNFNTENYMPQRTFERINITNGIVQTGIDSM